MSNWMTEPMLMKRKHHAFHDYCLAMDDDYRKLFFDMVKYQVAFK